MPVEITSKTFTVTAPLKDRIQSRFDKLKKLQVPLINPHVIVKKEGDQFHIEATVGIPQGDLFAEAQHEDMYTAVNNLGQKLERQLKSQKEKPVAHRAARSGKETLRQLAAV
ncbi:ribosome-associated translation inhibitor RaiA [Gallaecimonas sp. GXIMD4217]|uniref:ribosome hibernation-promoting factor, HPF/YfiA family n=1 Tax=Gallaecimonas sp. GXIMD4217 TaxID=3131927 RepID=UPI00311AD468